MVSKILMSNFCRYLDKGFHFLIPVRQTDSHYTVNDVLIFVKQFKRP